MGIKRWVASADNTITNAYRGTLREFGRTGRGTGSNMGASDILEVFSIYGQTSGNLPSHAGTTGEASPYSQELSRILIKFPVTEISSSRASGSIPASGNVSFYMKMFNADHGRTLPRNIILSASAIKQDWQEGFGMDMEEYSDETYNISGSNWINYGAANAWSSPGGDYYLDSISSFQTSMLEKGTEDLEIDISHLAEQWLTGSAAATAEITITDATQLVGDTIAIITTDGTTITATADANTTTTTDTNSPTFDVEVGGASSDRNATATALATCLDANSKIGATAASAVVTVTQAVAGVDGNTTITYTDVGGDGVGLTHDAKFTSGDGKLNYGVGVYLTASQEAYFSSSTGANTGSENSVLHNEQGARKSYYTKKFFGKNSEFFFKRPVIEARWDSSRRDHRGNLYLSSSLVPASENLQTLYLYNNVRGQLRNIPGIDAPADGADRGVIYLSLFSGTAADTAPSGSALKLVTDGTYVTSDIDSVVTGGWVATGIYSCSFATTSALGTLYDVWFSGGLGQTAAGGTQHFTGSITPLSLTASFINPSTKYVTAIRNLRPIYSRDEIARFRIYTRQKDWNPNIYTRAIADPESLEIESGSYRILRTIDNYEIIGYGTGSDLHTVLSYDISGNYFDLEMSMLESGYSYAFKFAYYNNAIGTWVEQKEKFKFRVED